MNPLSSPTDVFVDAPGNIYVSDQGNSVVKKWTPGSAIPVIVAGGNGYGANANQLSTPTGIFVDAYGNVYVCDTDNNRIQEWAPGATTGVTVANDQLADPLEIYVDCAGNMFVANFSDNSIRKFVAGGNSGITIAGGNGAGTNANQLNGPIGVFMDAAHTLYVAEFYNNRVQKFETLFSPTYTPLATGDYTATVIYDGGSVTSNIVSIVAPKMPEVNIISSSMSICQGYPDTFKATTANSGILTNYQWKKNAINVGANPVVSLDRSVTLCKGGSKQLDAGDFSSYLWNDGSIARTLSINSVGTYYVTVTGNNGCTGSDTLEISRLLPAPDGFLPTDLSLCINTTLNLESLATYKTYLWNTGATSPGLSISKPGAYWLEVTDSNNCKGKNSVNVVSKDCLLGFYIPNVFTPNNDGKNDFFKPLLTGNLQKFEFWVYNQWGQTVYHSTDNNAKGRDGNFAGIHEPANIYVWLCIYQREGRVTETKKGSFLLVR